jgi:hypothetical protein
MFKLVAGHLAKRLRRVQLVRAGPLEDLREPVRRLVEDLRDLQEAALCMESSGYRRDTAWAMSEENVEVTQQIFRAWERADFSSVEWADPGIAFHIQSGADDAIHTGIEAMGQAWAEWLRAWDEFRVEAREFIDRGDMSWSLLSSVVAARRAGCPPRQCRAAACFRSVTAG